METLYDITKEYLVAMDSMEINEDGEILNADAIELAEGAFLDKAESVAIYIKSLQAEAKAHKGEEALQKKKREACEKKAEWLTHYLDINMKAAEISSHKTARVNLSYRKSDKVVLEDEMLIPDDFKEYVTEVKISKADIKKAIKAGEIVPGVRLEICENLQIK